MGAWAKPKKKKLKQCQGSPSKPKPSTLKPKKVGQENLKPHQRSRKKVENDNRIETVAAEIGVVPSSGSETLRRKSGEKCVGNWANSSNHVGLIWNVGKMDLSVRQIPNNVSVKWRWRSGNVNTNFNSNACRRNMRWKWSAWSK